ncbi:MAG: hypothetical protein P9M14_17000 [Candidatus Alcyoniella australis]|nr:hypothetical protein [Candidatus Alcyoniella australis]
MKRRLIALAVALLLAALAVGCSKNVDLERSYRGTRGSYFSMLQNWTRGDKVYDGLDCVLQARATLISEPMETALNAERARSHGPAKGVSAPERDVLGVAVRPELQLVMLALYTQKSAANDIARQPSSWSVWLQNERGVTVQAESIIPVKVRPEELRELFPYLDGWSTPYLVLFPAQDDQGAALWDEQTATLDCIVSGPIGRAQMTWRFK